MPFAIRGKIEGVDEVLKRLKGLDTALRRKLLKQAVNAATRQVLRAAKAQAPVGATGLLRKSLGRKVKVYRHSGTVVGIIGPRVGYKTAIRTVTRGSNKGRTVYANPTQYAHLVEQGTRPHSLGAGSHLYREDRAHKGESQHGAMHPGAQAKPFLAPAFVAAQAPALEAMRAIIEAGIEKAAGGGA